MYRVLVIANNRNMSVKEQDNDVLLIAGAQYLRLIALLLPLL